MINDTEVGLIQNPRRIHPYALRSVLWTSAGDINGHLQKKDFGQRGPWEQQRIIRCALTSCWEKTTRLSRINRNVNFYLLVHKKKRHLLDWWCFPCRISKQVIIDLTLDLFKSYDENTSWWFKTNDEQTLMPQKSTILSMTSPEIFSTSSSDMLQLPKFVKALCPHHPAG